MYLANLIQVIYKTIHITLDLDILVTRDTEVPWIYTCLIINPKEDNITESFVWIQCLPIKISSTTKFIQTWDLRFIPTYDSSQSLFLIWRSPLFQGYFRDYEIKESAWYTDYLFNSRLKQKTVPFLLNTGNIPSLPFYQFSHPAWYFFTPELLGT